MKNVEIVGFASDNMQNLCREIKECAEILNSKIIQISAYCDPEKALDQRALVIFEIEEEKYEKHKRRNKSY